METALHKSAQDTGGKLMFRQKPVPALQNVRKFLLTCSKNNLCSTRAKVLTLGGCYVHCDEQKPVHFNVEELRELRICAGAVCRLIRFVRSRNCACRTDSVQRYYSISHLWLDECRHCWTCRWRPAAAEAVYSALSSGFATWGTLF